jgi:hypothetical protein
VVTIRTGSTLTETAGKGEQRAPVWFLRFAQFIS